MSNVSPLYLQKHCKHLDSMVDLPTAYLAERVL